MAVPLLRAVVGSTVAVVLAWVVAVLVGRFVMPDWGVHWTALPDASGWGPALALVGLWLVLIPPVVLVLRVAMPEDVRQVWELFGQSEGTGE